MPSVSNGKFSGAKRKPGPSLKQVQKWLSWVFRDPQVPAVTLKSPIGPEPRPRALLSVRQSPPVHRLSRIEIYWNGYHARLLECLEDWYPATRAVVEKVQGENSFPQLVTLYLWKHPSTSRNIMDAGAKLPGFIKRNEISGAIPYLADLARLEWECLSVIHEPPASTLSPEALMTVPADAWASARLGLDPAARLLRSSWDLHPLWLAASEEKRFSAPPRAKSWIGVFRTPDGWYDAVPLDRPQWELLLALSRKKTLASAIEEVAARSGAELPVGEWLREWIVRGWIRSIDLERKARPVIGKRDERLGR